LIAIKINQDKTRADFASVLAGPRLAIERASDERLRDHSWAHIEQVGRQGALSLDCHAGRALVLNCKYVARHISDTLGLATELCATKNDAGSRFLSWFSRLAILRRETTQPFFAPGEMIQLQLGDELILVSTAAPSRARETRRAENRRLSSPIIPPPALTPRCAGASGDRPDLPADDYSAPSTAEPVAAAAIGSVVGSFASAGDAMRCDSILRQQEQKN